MNSVEKEIFKSLLKRKFAIEIEEDAFSVIAKINSQKKSSGNKRFEENYKLVFKRAYKALLKKFAKDRKLKCRKMELQKRFFDYYFKSESDNINLQLDEVKIDRPKKFEYYDLNPNTITESNIEKFVDSEKYLHALLEYIDKIFIKDYMHSNEAKLDKVVENCQEILKKEGIAKVKENIEKNQKYKLPWTLGELCSAKTVVLDKLSEKINSRGYPKHLKLLNDKVEN